MTTTTQPLTVAREGAYATITLNRPERMNAINFELLLALRGALEELYVDTDVRAVIVTGAGEKAFSAGADLKERAGMTPLRCAASSRRSATP